MKMILEIEIIQDPLNIFDMYEKTKQNFEIIITRNLKTTHTSHIVYRNYGY